jgi:flagellar biosynthetic protein FlhB
MADEQRSERATPKRRQKALERGQMVRSRELPSALTLLGVAALLRSAEGGGLPIWRDLFRHLLAAGSHGDMSDVVPVLNWTSWGVARWAVPPLALAWCVSAMGMLVQGGFVLTPLAFEPKFDRFNPATNISHIFSIHGLSQLLKSLVPAGFLIYVAWTILSRDWIRVIHSTQMGLPAALAWLFSVLYEFAWKAGLILLVWSAVDYGFQKLNYEKSMKMSKHEVREEYKDSEGNPATRGRIRRRRMEMRKRQQLQQVSRATVVITNPDEFAVALEYIPEKMAAPLVLAKGRGELAQKIKREARWHEVPIVENPPLAQVLYRTVEVGGTIPAKLYTAVAEVLAFIYRAQARVRADGAARTSERSNTPNGPAAKPPEA